MDVQFRPAPTPEQQAAAEERVKWDEPVGRAHAFKLLEILSTQGLTPSV